MGLVSINKKPVKVEAGELIVPEGDLVIPSKLRLLAESGWSIVDVCKEGKEFRLLLIRNVEVDNE